MKKLLLILLVFAARQAVAQNAFFDAQYLVRWYRLSDDDPVKLRQCDTALAKMIRYGDLRAIKDPSRSLFLANIYEKAYAIFINRLIGSFTREEIVAAAQARADSMLNGQVQTLLRALRDSSARITQADALIAAVRARKTAWDKDSLQPARLALVPADLITGDSALAASEARYEAALAGSASPDSAFRAAGLTALEDLLLHAERYRAARVADTIELKNGIYTTVLAQRDRYRQFFVQVHTTGSPANPLLVSFNRKAGAISQDMRALLNSRDNMAVNLTYPKLVAENERAAAAASFAASNAASLTDMNFPKQSQIIDALAIYLARRMKQEAVLFFMENLGKTLKDDEMAQQLFPQTWQLLRNELNTSVPRFGAQWKASVSADLLDLPVNVCESRYVRSRVQDELVYGYLHDAVLFGTMVSKRFNFIEIVQFLHDNPDTLRGKWFRAGTDVMYILSQELYDTSGTAFWVHPQRFTRLDTSQLYTLLDLVRVKYSGTLSPVIDSALAAPARLRGQTKQVMRFYTELLTLLRHFTNMQSNPVKAPNGEVIQDGFWDAQLSFMDFLLNDQQLLHLDIRERKALELCRSGFNIYQQLGAKNYLAASGEVIGAIGTLIGHKSRLLIDLDSAQLATLRKSPVTRPLYAPLAEANKFYTQLLQLNGIREAVASLPDTATISLAFLQERFSPNRYNGIMQGALSLPNWQFQRNDFIGFLARLDAQWKTAVIVNYDSVIRRLTYIRKHTKELGDDVLAVVKEAENGKIVYRDLKKLTTAALDLAPAVAMNEDSRYFRWLTRFSELMTEIASTQNSKELANVIESYALPPGSYRNKRNSVFSLDINAYPGIFLGLERLSGQPAFKAAWGITAPVGISFSWGLGRRFRNGFDEPKNAYMSRVGRLRARRHTNFAIDLSLIDIAAVLSYRLENGEDKGLPADVRWSQIFSPGVNLRYSIGNTPLCLGAGVQYTPKLRYSSLTQESRDALRFHAGVAFDLPLFNVARSRY